MHTLCLLLVLWAGAPAAGMAQDGVIVSPDLQQDLLGATLAGEYALQAGRLGEALDWYLHAARAAPEDAAVAERAAWIAFLGADDNKAAVALQLWKARVRYSLPVRASEVQLAIRTGKLRAARRELIILLKETDPAGWPHALNALEHSQRDPIRLVQLIDSVLDADAMPQEWAAWIQLRTLVEGMNARVLSTRIMHAIVERFPDAPPLPLLRAQTLRETGAPDQARAVLAGADEARLIGNGLGWALAQEYLQLGEFAKAEQVLAQGTQTAQVVGMRAWLFSRTGNTGELARLYAQLRQDADVPDPAQRLLLGQLAESLERLEEALEWYAAVPTGEERIQAQLRGIIVLHRLGRSDEAYTRVRQLQEAPQLDKSLRLNACLLEADLRQRDGDLAGEAAAFARGLAAYPDALALLYARSLMWERRDDLARAEADLRLILITAPDNSMVLNALGYMLANRTHRYAEALALIERARLAEPDEGSIIDSYGWVLYRLGRSEEALTHLRRAYSLQKDAEIAAHVAEVLWVLGHHEEARAYFDEAKKIDPGNRALQRALQETGA